MYGYYLKVKFKEKYDGRKIWYYNDTYLCDCVNTPFINKADCEKWIPELMNRKQYPYGNNLESVTIHRTKLGGKS